MRRAAMPPTAPSSGAAPLVGGASLPRDTILSFLSSTLPLIHSSTLPFVHPSIRPCKGRNPVCFGKLPREYPEVPGRALRLRPS